MNYKVRLENGFLVEDIINTKSLEEFNDSITKKYIGCPDTIRGELKTIYSKVHAVKQQVIKDSLETIKKWAEEDNDSLDTSMGICGNVIQLLVENFTNKVDRSLCIGLNMPTILYYEEFIYDLSNEILGAIIMPLFEQWPKFSGDLSFPVPDPDDKLGHSNVYHMGSDDYILWTGEYGNLRKELLDFLISNF